MVNGTLMRMNLLMPTKKIPAKSLTGCALIIIVVVIGISAFEARKARNLRQNLDILSARNYLEKDWPHLIAGRVVLMTPGCEAYNEDIASLSLRKGILRNSFYNRMLLNNLLESLTDEQLLRLLPRYPLTPKKQLCGLCIRGLSVDSADFRDASRVSLRKASLLGLLQQIPNCHEYVEAVTRNMLEPGRDKEMFLNALGSLVLYNIVEWDKLLRIYWEDLNNDQKDRALVVIGRNIAPNVHNYELLLDLTRTLGVDEPKQKVLLMVPFVDVLRADPGYDFLLKKALRTTEYPTLGEEVGSWDSLKSWKAAIKPERQLATAEYLLDLAYSVNVSLAAGLFHWILDDNEKRGIKLSRKILEGPDSVLRKAVLVLLARHDKLPLSVTIDEAFTGNKPRRTYFKRHAQYMFGSVATAEYEKLAGHGYLGTGKTWMPKSSAGIKAWTAFINRYPWHPGTDDAYYQAASILLAQEDFENFWPLLEEYFKRELPDVDATPFLSLLVREALMRDRDSHASSAFHKYGRRIVAYPLAVLLASPNKVLVQQRRSVQWLLKNEHAQKKLSVNPETLTVTKELLDEWISATTVGRILAIVEKLSNNNDRFYEIMYGLNNMADKLVGNSDFHLSIQVQKAQEASTIARYIFFQHWNSADLESRYRNIDGALVAAWCLLHTNKESIDYIKDDTAPLCQ